MKQKGIFLRKKQMPQGQVSDRRCLKSDVRCEMTDA